MKRKHLDLKFYFYALFILAPLVLACRVYAADIVDKIVVVVNDASITKSEISEAMKPVAERLKKSYSGEELDEKLKEAHQVIIERLIEDRLILQEAKKQNITAADIEIEEKMGQIKSKFPNKEAFENALEQQGLNLWELKKNHKEQIIIKKMVRQYVRQKVKITPLQIAQYYQQHINDFKMPQAVDISQILIKYKPEEGPERAEKTAMQVRELLSVGADFKSVAEKYSEGPNAKTGGNLGFVERGIMTKEIDDVILNMQEGEISKPINTNSGFVIIKVNAIRNEKTRPLEEAKTEIEELLLDENAKTLIEKWISELKSKAFISIKE